MGESDNDNMRPRHLSCLIVEDNFFAADVLSIYLKRNGIECEIAENGEIGLNMYLANPLRYDLILCDLQMPVMDGYAMMRRIRSSGLETAVTIPIVAMSGTFSGDTVGQNLFSYFLKKPFELNCLLGIIVKVLNCQTYFKQEQY